MSIILTTLFLEIWIISIETFKKFNITLIPAYLFGTTTFSLLNITVISQLFAETIKIPLNINVFESVLCILLAPISVYYLKKNQFQNKVFPNLLRSLSIKSRLMPFLTVSVLSAILATIEITGNDSLLYLADGKFISDQNNLTHFPIIDAVKTGGLYDPGSHPPHFVLLLSLIYKFPATNFFLRLLTILFLINTIQIVRKMVENRLLCTLLLLSVPIYLSGILDSNLDIFRIYFFTVGFGLYRMSLNQDRQKSKNLLLFLAISIPMVAHASGLLISTLFIIHLSANKNQKLQTKILISISALIFSGTYYLMNTIKFGSPVFDTFPVANIPILNYQESVDYERTLIGPLHAIFGGVLAPFVNLRLFGITYLLGLFCLIRMISPIKTITLKKIRDIELSVFIFVSFFIIDLITFFIGNDLIYKNPRYALSVLPFVVVLISERIK